MIFWMTNKIIYFIENIKSESIKEWVLLIYMLIFCLCGILSPFVCVYGILMAFGYTK